MIINPFMLNIAAPAAPFITGQSLGTLRNNFTGCVGFKITIGATDITVSELGRWKVAGNSGSHTIKITTADGTVIVSAVVDMTAGSDATYVYASCSPTVLSASGVYFVLSSETNGGDQWYDINTSVTPTLAATVNDGAFQTNCTGSPNATGGSNKSYVPVNFKYS
jgi:hypothetical protein